MAVLFMKGSVDPQIAQLRSQVASALGPAATEFRGLVSSNTTFDSVLDAAVRRWQGGSGLEADGIVGPYCLGILGLLAPATMAVPLTVANVKQLFPVTKLSNIQRYLPYVAAALGAAGLTGRPMIFAALGTIRAETEGFVPISEGVSHFNTPGTVKFGYYDGKLGNDQPGDGARYCGRGFVQLTGKDNYRTLGAAIGVDLVAHPDLANAPEPAALILASFLAKRATAIVNALASGNYAAARRQVNGGSFGLDRFQDVFHRAADVWPENTVSTRVGSGRGVGIPTTASRPVHALNASKDPVDLRDRSYMPAPKSLPDRYPSDSSVRTYLPRYTKARLVLDQGQDGSCTGFGLGCVINYLRWCAHGMPQRFDSVSTRMLYNNARRYDEYSGEDYEGSSCRGALRGWFHNGVCMSELWPYDAGDHQPPRFGYAKAARANTLGVYYRIDTRSLTDLQAAIRDVGAIYVSAYTHGGWIDVHGRHARVTSHASLPVIEFSGAPSRSDGHAFALVGYNTRGFVVQNSWGTSWGSGGFAVLTYADWMANGMDAWVAAMGVPGVLADGTASPIRAATARAGSSPWDATAADRQFGVVIGNNGRVDEYFGSDTRSQSLTNQASNLPDQWFRQQPDKTKRLVIYAHGGLNSEDDAMTRVHVMRSYFTRNGCYPLFLVWKTGLLETLGNILSNVVTPSSDRAGGRWLGELTDFTDGMVQNTIGSTLGRAAWTNMKDNARLASEPLHACDQLVTALQQLIAIWGDQLEIHLIGHSAGAIFHGWLLDLFKRRGLEDRARSLHLYAPACTVQFANDHLATHEHIMQNLYMDILSDENERGDVVTAIYRKSLLYLISNALEPDSRTPILGMANVENANYPDWDGTAGTAQALNQWRATLQRTGADTRLKVVTSPTVRTTGQPTPARSDVMIRSTHGSFDNNIDVLTRTLERITGGPLKAPVTDLLHA